VDSQRPAVEQLAAARGFSVVRVFEEQMSVTKRRPQWEAVKAAAHRGDFDVLVIAAIDRIGRSMAGNINEILALDRMGVRVVSVREPWLDMGGPVRDLLVAIFSWVAAEERRVICERTLAGVAAARRRGAKLGRPKAHLDVFTAVRLRKQGLSLRQIAKRMGASYGVVQRAIRDADLDGSESSDAEGS
jgi:DNA invertase Pin-like site-specific DNA recombinase